LADVVDEPLVKSLSEVELQAMHSPVDLVSLEGAVGAILPPFPYALDVGSRSVSNTLVCRRSFIDKHDLTVGSKIASAASAKLVRCVMTASG
jgi:hypothetical protein